MVFEILAPFKIGMPDLTKRTDVVEINRKFLREILAQILSIDPPLFLQDKFFFLRLICGRETLPWERAPEEVEKHVPEGFQIIAAMLHLTKR